MKIVIFAGGVGSRLWPLSRKNTPKQFEKIVGDQSTLQLAAQRLQPDFSWEDLYVATGKAFVEVVRDQLPQMPKEHVIGEPMMRDVGPAVALMTRILVKESPNEPMAILWSDHLVKQEPLFRKILRVAGEYVKKDPNKVIFVAQKPRFASENLGWIHYGDESFEKETIPFYEFVGFKYRPDSEKAKEYFNSGHHGWNLGYFVTTPQFLWKQFEKLAPETAEKIDEIVKEWGKPKFNSKLEKIYPTLEKIHFDNVILEKLDPTDAYVTCENIEWSDIGAWEALKEALSVTKDENVTKGNVLLEDSRDSLIFNFKNQTVVGIDLDDIVIVNTEDVVLVCPKNSVPKIKKFVEKLDGTEHEHLA
ncbi:MAG TPA: sugar phosphate nucleotidyltransferase [Patescibacteria group bacterium]